MPLFVCESIGNRLVKLVIRVSGTDVDQAVALDVQIGGSEANVMAAVARMGLRTAFISALPSEHAWGDRTVRELSGHGVDCAGILRRPGSRMGLYFLEYGALPRPVRVLYDRRDSAIWTLSRPSRSRSASASNVVQRGRP